MRAERDNLDRRQSELDSWRAGLDAGRIQPELRDQLVARPAPTGPHDRMTIPRAPKGFGDAGFAARDRAAWWHEHGREWWDALRFEELSPGFQSSLLIDHPGLRNGEGIPAPVRDTLNRRYIQLEIARIGTPRAEGRTPEDARRLGSLRTALADLHTAELEATIAAGRAGVDRPTVWLLSFDQDAQGHRPGTSVAFGPVDTAATVHWHPSVNTAIDSVHHAVTQAAAAHVEIARAQPDHATVAWIDHEPRGAGEPSRALSGRGRDRPSAAVSAFADAHPDSSVTVRGGAGERNPAPQDTSHTGARPRRPHGLNPQRGTTTRSITRPDGPIAAEFCGRISRHNGWASRQRTPTPLRPGAGTAGHRTYPR